MLTTVVAESNSTDYNYTGPADSSSPGFNGVNGTGQSEYNGPQTNESKWNSTVSGDLRISIGSEGTIYGATGNKLYAFSKNGTLKWNVTLYSTRTHTPAIGNNETIYISDGYQLYAFDNNGSQKWNYTFGLTNASNLKIFSPTIGPDGTIYIFAKPSSGLVNGDYYAFNPDGSLKWQSNIASSDFPPVFDSQGNIYFGYTTNGSSSTGSKLFKISSDNNNNSTFSTFTFIQDTSIYIHAMVIGSDDNLYILGTIGSTANPIYLFALYENGSVKWQSDSLNLSYNSVIAPHRAIQLSKTGIIYISAPNLESQLYAVNSTDGKILHTIVMQSIFNIVIGGDGTIYLSGSNRNHNLYALNPDLTIKWSFNFPNTASAMNPVIGDDGTLYVSSNGTLYAFQDLISDFTSTPEGKDGFNFADNSTNIPVGWYWKFGDGSTSTEKNPIHHYIYPGNYTVNLTVITAGGTTATVSHIVEVKDTTIPTVSSNKESGTYYGSVNVVLTINENGKIYYTTDGSDPSSSATRKEYTGQIAIGSTTSLQYIAVDDAGNPSSLYLLYFNIKKDLIPGDTNVKPGNYNKDVVVNLPTVSGSTLYYSVDGKNYKIYTGKLTLSKTTTLSYYYLDKNGAKSKVKSVTYTIDKTAPKVTSTNPKKNKKVSASTKKITLKFSENIKFKDKKSIKKIILKTSKGKKVAVKAKINGKNLVISFKKLSKKTNYVLTIGASQIKDVIGNFLKSKTTLKFKTK